MPGLNARPSHSRHSAGFTLVELALVLIVVAILAGGMLAPLGPLLDERGRRETLDRLRDIEQALTGFAILHGRLPCPTLVADPAAADYGLEHPPPCDDSTVGYLPWRTLGVPPTDAWGAPRHSASAPWTGHWRYRVDRAFAPAQSPTPQRIDAATMPASNLQLVDHRDDSISTTSSRVVAVVLSTGPNRRADGHNASYSRTAPKYELGETTAEFDDLVVWIGQPLLIARLAQAGRL